MHLHVTMQCPTPIGIAPVSCHLVSLFHEIEHVSFHENFYEIEYSKCCCSTGASENEIEMSPMPRSQFEV